MKSDIVKWIEQVKAGYIKPGHIARMSVMGSPEKFDTGDLEALKKADAFMSYDWATDRTRIEIGV